MNKCVLIFIFLTLSSLTTWAYPSKIQNLTCITEHPSTSYFFDLDEDEYTLNVIHHNGVNYAPIYDGLVTIATIDYLKTSVENIVSIGDRIDFKFKTSDCLRLEKNRITCYKSGVSQLGGLKVEDVYFNVYENSDSSTYGVFKDVRISLDYRINKKIFRMPMNFPAENCSNRF